MAASAILPPSDAFKKSYTEFQDYPLNLVLRNSYTGALKSYRSRLDQFASRLFQRDQIYVAFREFAGNGIDGGLRKEIVVDEATLEAWLGCCIPQGEPPANLAIKKDPNCRFIFITADSSRDPLKLTQNMLLKILSFHQVMPAYLDFLSVFGSQNEARDLRFSGFRELTSLSATNRALISDLGRSGRRYQLSYNLKAVACKSVPKVDLTKRQWSIRQAAIHHQFDVEAGTSLWIITQGHSFIKERIQEVTASHSRPEDRAFGTSEDCFRTSLTTHLLNCHWSIEEWRWYIQWLEEVIEKETNPAVYGIRGARGEIVYTPEHIQMVQHREDKINEAVMILQANNDVILSLRSFYTRLIDVDDFDLRITCRSSIMEFAAQLDDMVYDSKMQIARATVLVKITAERKNLILQHLQSQATVKMEELTQLTVKIGTMSQREAIAMRIITVVTLVYLPATFVSTFFSTDIVKYQNPNSDNTNPNISTTGQYMGSFSEVAMLRWLQVTLPLTFITGAIAIAAFRRSGKKADEQFKLAELPFYKDENKI